MSTLVAIDISATEATVVTASTSSDETIDLVQITTVARSEFQPGDVQQVDEDSMEGEESPAAEESDDEASSATSQADSEEHTTRVKLEERLGIEFDKSLAILPGHNVLYRRIILPFADQKKVDQVAPIQLQDAIPFDIDDFVIDNIVLGKLEAGGYDVLSSLSPGEHVEETLVDMERLGADPVLLTTKASALGALADLAVEDRSLPFGILEFSNGRCSMAIFVEEKLCHVREFAASQDSNSAEISRELLANIQCSIGRSEKLLGQELAALYVLAPKALVETCRLHLGAIVRMLDLSPYVRNYTQQDVAIDRYAWAIGLFAKEMIGSKQRVEFVDFRKGSFAYKPAWGAFWEAFRLEAFYIFLAIILGIGAVATSYFTVYRDLRKVEDKIASVVATAGVTEKIPARREVMVLEEKVSEIETQLRSMGSLSSLSPLDSLKELSQAITADIDIRIDSVNIGFSRLLLRGTVADNPTVGRLEGILKKREKRFCKVTVDPKGRLSGSSRVKFTAEIELCE